METMENSDLIDSDNDEDQIDQAQVNEDNTAISFILETKFTIDEYFKSHNKFLLKLRDLKEKSQNIILKLCDGPKKLEIERLASKFTDAFFEIEPDLDQAQSSVQDLTYSDLENQEITENICQEAQALEDIID